MRGSDLFRGRLIFQSVGRPAADVGVQRATRRLCVGAGARHFLRPGSTSWAFETPSSGGLILDLLSCSSGSSGRRRTRSAALPRRPIQVHKARGTPHQPSRNVLKTHTVSWHPKIKPIGGPKLRRPIESERPNYRTRVGAPGFLSTLIDKKLNHIGRQP